MMADRHMPSSFDEDTYVMSNLFRGPHDLGKNSIAYT